MRCLLYSILLPLFAVGSLAAASVPVQGRVLEVLPEANSLRVELTESANADLSAGQTVDFRVGPGDLEIGYVGRLIRAEAVDYSSVWHLERVFPVDGIGAKAMVDINKQLHDATATMSRRKYVREGDYIPNFAMIDQHGDFLQIRELRGKAFVLNFIFTRCRAATMCPASTTRMSELQEIAREGGMDSDASTIHADLLNYLYGCWDCGSDKFQGFLDDGLNLHDLELKFALTGKCHNLFYKVLGPCATLINFFQSLMYRAVFRYVFQ